MSIDVTQWNNFSHAAMDVWRERVLFNGKLYHAGFFSASVLNTSEELISIMKTHSMALLKMTSCLFCRSERQYEKVWPKLARRIADLAELLWLCEPFSRLDRANDLRLINTFLSKKYYPLVTTVGTYEHSAFLNYINSMVQVPYALAHFIAAGQYFEQNYLHQLDKRAEADFAMAAESCFSSEQFWAEMNSLEDNDTQPFTVHTQPHATWMFSSAPKGKTVLTNRMLFDSYMDFFVYDLFNGLHNGAAPSRCQNCGKYFLTINAHTPKYCNGTAPQDSRLTCRQYGAKHGDKESNANHPVYNLFSTKTNTIRKHRERGKISAALKAEALKIAVELRDKALMDNAYAEDGYKRDMEPGAIYGEARKRLAQKGIASS